MHKTLYEIADIRYGKSPNDVKSDTGVFPIIGTSGVVGKASEALFDKPAIVVGRKGTLDNPILSSLPFWAIDTTYAVLPKAGVNIRWLFYCLLSANLKNLNEATGVPSLSRDSLGNLNFYFPSIDEQETIASILDTIDEAIAAAEAQLAKQEKIKQGLLQDLLTRGIDETGQIRPHWDDRPDLYKKTELGLIPKVWEINLLGNICTRGGGNVQTGPFGSQLHAEDYKEQGVPIITVEHLNELFISHENLPLVGEGDYFRLRRYDLKIGDLVFSRVGAIDRCAYVTEKEDGWLFSGRCLRVRAGNSINSKYLAFVLNSHRQRQWILNAAVGSTMACLNTSILSNVPITEPAEYEQKFVADNLFEVTSVTNELKADIRKLQLIKTGLMQDLLTGRRRVTAELIRQVETLTGSP